MPRLSESSLAENPNFSVDLPEGPADGPGGVPSVKRRDSDLPRTTTAETQLREPVSAGTKVSSDGSSVAIDHLVMHNFKSYKDEHVVGPFDRFTAIIGPNGSGKSNLMDAISFVLGIQSRHMRGTSLEDLIYRPPRQTTTAPSHNDGPSGETTRPTTECSVQLVLRQLDADGKVSFVRLKRSIKPRCSGTLYYVDNAVVSAEAYRQRLLGMGINIRTRNFLIFQGDVVDVARRSPTELGILFEQISGADLLKEDYERAETSVQDFMTQSKHLMVLKQRALAQKTDLSQQVAEVNLYRDLERQIQEEEMRLAAFQLFANEARAAQESEELEKAVAQASTLEANLQQAIATGRPLDAAVVVARDASSEATKKLQAQIAVITGLERDIGVITEKLRFEKRRQTTLQQAADSTLLKQNRLQENANELQEEIATVEKELAALKLQAETLDDARNPEKEIPKKLLGRFKELKERADAATAASKAKQWSLEKRLQNISSTVASVAAEKAETESRLKEIREKQIDLEQKLASARMDLNEKMERRQQLEAEVTFEGHAFNERSNEERHLRQKKWEFDFQLNNLLAKQNEAGRVAKTRRLINQLQEALPGLVHGTCGELGRATNRRYNAAIAAALGKFNETVVVENFSTAQKSISLLKQWRSGVLEFAALDSIVAPTRVDRKATEASGLTWALDCVHYDPKFSHVFQAALADTVIVENLREAERVAFRDTLTLGVRVKVVTLDAEKVLKNGNFTMDTHLRKVDSFSHQEISRITSELSVVEARLAALGANQSALQQKKYELTNLVAICETQEAKLRMLEDRESEFIRETERLQTGLSERLLSLEADATNQRAIANREVQETLNKIEEIEREIFSELPGSLDIAALRRAARVSDEEQRNRDSAMQAANMRLVRLKTELAGVEEELKRTRSASSSGKLLKDSNVSTEKLEAQLTRLQAKHEKALNVKAAVTKESQEQTDAHNAALAKLTEHQKETQKLRADLTNQQLEVKRRTAALETLTNEGIKLLKDSLLAGIEFPLLRGTMQDYARILQTPFQRVNREQNTLLALPGSTTTNDLTESPRAMTDDSETPEIDYDACLDAQLQESCNNINSARHAERKLGEKLGSLRSTLSKSTPNFKAVERFAATNDDLERLETRLNLLEVEKSAAEREFYRLKRERTKRFMHCFRTVQAEIDKIYNSLTGGELDIPGTGGQAFLDLLEIPTGSSSCKYGVVYSVMPPTKRFSDLRRLSGGEKTIAALALLFALQRVNAGAFFVLDEVDAALDPVNIGYLATYFRNTQFQIIVISHADRVFSESDALIGVYSDNLRESSVTLTLDLSQYEAPPTPSTGQAL